MRVVGDRISETRGSSSDAILGAVSRRLAQLPWVPTAPVVDLGCGQGRLRSVLPWRGVPYVGVDLDSHGAAFGPGEFVCADLSRPLPLGDGCADVVVAVEVVEHLENPRALFREAVRILRPGGLLVVTTPNQESVLSLLSLWVHGEFVAFREGPGMYPSHLSALLRVDLLRMAAECGLGEVAIHYTDRGRIPGTPLQWPRPLRGRRFSDNVLLSATKLDGGAPPQTDRA